MAQQPLGADNQPVSSTGGDTKITVSGVQRTLGTIHDNIQKTLKNPKTVRAFMMDYTSVQKGVQKQMGGIDKSEGQMNKDLDKTERNVKKIKNQKGKGLLSMLVGGVSSLLLTMLGGLILITLARIALRKWKSKYMPPSDKSTMTIFGVKIPGWDEIKSLGLRIFNFIKVGLPNLWDRMKHFFGDLKKKMFGKKGIFRNAAQTKSTLFRILGAIFISQTKRVGVMILKILFKVLSFIPFVGPIFGFLADFAPAVYTFITTQLMLIWQKKQAEGEEAAKNIAAGQQAQGATMMNRINKQLKQISGRIKPFKSQTAAIPGLQTSLKGTGSGRKPQAIMRQVPTSLHNNQKIAEGI